MIQHMLRFLGWILLAGVIVQLVALSLKAQTKPHFTPGEDCRAQIIAAINSAKFSICVQAYNFTDPAIAQALASRARPQPGGDGTPSCRVYIILDKVAASQKGCQGSYCAEHGCIVRIDSKHKIAHNKIMIFDYLPKDHDQDTGAKVITGSYNFSKSAQESNAENLLIISHPDSPSGRKLNKNIQATIKRYYDNFYLHWNHTVAFIPKEDPAPIQPANPRGRRGLRNPPLTLTPIH